jgi:TRAP-type C4-dicarboxylate transport system substrate-binding protein
MKKTLLQSALMMTVGCASITTADAAEVTLRFAHHFPSVSTPNKALFEAWADKVEADSNGRIEVQMFPSSTLSKPPAQYDAVVNGIADITATIQGYTANRFPLTQVVELPGVADNAAHGSCIVQKLYDEGLIADEYKNTKPLFLFTHGPGHIHTSKKAINTPADLAGLRIRRPSPVVGRMLEGLGAQPVGMPAPESYQAVQRGVIDGVSLPWEGELVFRLNELTPYHTEVGGLYTLAFVVTMNKNTYNRLPDDLKKVIDDNSGIDWSIKAGQVFDELDKKGREQAVKEGHTIHVVEGGIENPEWKPVVDQMIAGYLADFAKKGLPVQAVYQRAEALAETCQ